jgi:DNA topoisomerase-1
MRIAQRLYEGVDIGGETVGLITYMRTDGVDMAPEAVQAARRVIAKETATATCRARPAGYTSKAQERAGSPRGHPPTDMGRLPPR